MVDVDVAVAAGPDEVADVEVALLREHVRQERVAGDVERNSQEDVCASLVDLAAETAPPAAARARDMELEERVTGLERHAREIRDVPRADHDPPRIRLVAQEAHDLGDLVAVAPVTGGQAAQLHAVHPPEPPDLSGQFIPARDPGWRTPSH